MVLDRTQRTMTGHSLAALALRIEHQEIEEVGGPGPRSPRCQDIRDSSKGPGESLNHLFLKVGNIRASSHPDARICCFWLHILSLCRCQQPAYAAKKIRLRCQFRGSALQLLAPILSSAKMEKHVQEKHILEALPCAGSIFVSSTGAAT